MKSEIDKILEKFENFDVTTGCRMLMLINRSHHHNDRRGPTRIMTNSTDEYIGGLERLMGMIKPGECIYASVNESMIRYINSKIVRK